MQNLERSQQRLAELDVAIDVFHSSLGGAIEDVRGCTDFDAPMMPGVMFWSRTNRYLAETLVPRKWVRTSRNSILRVIHPTGSHAITAISGAGGVGDLRKSVRSKNPKGSIMARLVEKNGQFAFMSRDQILFGRELEDVPTWFLLYQWRDGVLSAELSLPVRMNGQFVDEWLERIPLSLPNLGDPGADIGLLDEPDDDEGGPDVKVELLGG
ncbi:hypothetical protein ACFYPZ_19570 [Streptomyces sp. NPDC005506]|uniref:hypothetical protein n=1 Tax=Streptomyces sp. NPDC005506 TaxID=3364718 RepID=UPI0036C45A23